VFQYPVFLKVTLSLTAQTFFKITASKHFASCTDRLIDLLKLDTINFTFFLA
jgi:hypothetical protein